MMITLIYITIIFTYLCTLTSFAVMAFDFAKSVKRDRQLLFLPISFLLLLGSLTVLLPVVLLAWWLK